MSTDIGHGKYTISVDNTGAISQLQKFEDKTKQAGQSAKASFQIGLAGAIGLTSGITNLALSADRFEKINLRIKKTSLEVSRAQEEVNKLVKAGKTNTLDYQQAMERLGIAQEKLKIQQDDVRQMQIQFGLSIAQTAATIPSAISAVKGLAGATSILNVANSKFILIALAVVAAYEGIAQAIKHFTGQDYTITSSVQKMMGSMNILDAKTTASAEGFVEYGTAIGGVGASAQITAGSLNQLNGVIDTTNSKISVLKKNEDELSDILDNTYAVIGSLSQLADFLNDQATKKRIITLFRELEERGQGKTKTKTPKIGFKDLIAPMVGRNFKARALGHTATQYASYFSNLVTQAFSDVRESGKLRDSRQLHGNLGALGGLGQKVANILAQSTPASRLKRTNIGGRIGEMAGGYRIGGMFSKGRSARRGGGDKGRSAMMGKIEQEILEMTLAGEEFGLTPPRSPFERMPGSRFPAVFGSPSFEQQLQIYRAGVLAFQTELERRRQAPIAIRHGRAAMAGLTYSEVLALENAGRSEEIDHIIEFRRRLNAMSSGAV